MDDFENEFDAPEDYMLEEDYESDFDAVLEQQELEDFAQDGYFENMEPTMDGFWS